MHALTLLLAQLSQPIALVFQINVHQMEHIVFNKQPALIIRQLKHVISTKMVNIAFGIINVKILQLVKNCPQFW